MGYRKFTKKNGIVSVKRNVLFYFMVLILGARGEIVMVVGNGHGDPSSNLGRG